MKFKNSYTVIGKQIGMKYFKFYGGIKLKKFDGIIYALLSSAAFGIMPIFAKYAYNHGSNTLTVLSSRFLFSALILFLYFMFKGISLKLNKNQTITLILVSIFGYSSTATMLFFSYNYISLGLATTLHFVYPVVVVVANRIIFKEPLTKNKVIALTLSMLSIYLLVGFKVENINFLGISLALLSGFTHSISIIGMNRPELKELDNKICVFYFSIISGTIIFLITLLSGNLQLDVNLYTVMSMTGISTVSTILAIVLLMKAIKIIGPSPSAILGTFEPIVSIILGIILFGEAITLTIVIGTILILASVVILAKENTKENNINNEKPVSL